jgi:hypothetical protein
VNRELDEYAHLWGSEAKDYVLVSPSAVSIEPRSCMIFHLKGSNRRGTALVIEDDEIARAVIQRMVEAGVEIVDTVPSNSQLQLGN